VAYPTYFRVHDLPITIIYASKKNPVLACLCFWAVGPSVRPEHLWTRYLINLLRDFHQIYNFVAHGDKDELIVFWGQKVKVQGHNQTTCGQKRWMHIW